MLFLASAHLINDLPGNDIAVRLECLCARPIEFLNNVYIFLLFLIIFLLFQIVNNQLHDNVDDKENALDSWKRLSLDPVLWLDRLVAIYRVLKPWQSQNTFKELVIFF